MDSIEDKIKERHHAAKWVGVITLSFILIGLIVRFLSTIFLSVIGIACSGVFIGLGFLAMIAFVEIKSDVRYFEMLKKLKDKGVI